MTQFVTERELPLINKALAAGKDVRVQVTPEGCRIVEDTVKVLRRVKVEKNS